MTDTTTAAPAGHVYLRGWTRVWHRATEDDRRQPTWLRADRLQPVLCGRAPPSEHGWFSRGVIADDELVGFRVCRDCARKA